MNYEQMHKRLLAAQELFLEPTTTLEKFRAVRVLVKGIHVGIDEKFEYTEKALVNLEKTLSLDVISLTTENLPEATEEQKKRKKALLLFFETWNNLKGEVTRVQNELAGAEDAPDMKGRVSHWSRILNFAKGPLGIVTIVAIALVVTMEETSVRVVIHNQGCPTMYPSSTIPITLPGLSLPKNPIPSGGSAIAVLPALPFTIDGTKPGVLTASTIKFTMTFQLGGMRDVTLDGASLLGKKTPIHWGDNKEHNLVFVCK